MHSIRPIRSLKFLHHDDYCQNSKTQWKNIRAFLRFLDIATGYLLFSFIYFLYLFIFSVNKFILTAVNKTFCNLSLLKFFWHTAAVSRGVLPEEGVLWMCCGFSGAYRCLGAVSITLQRGFIVIALLHCHSPVGLLCLQTIFLEEHLWRTVSEQR